jgi:hypothetical protein
MSGGWRGLSDSDLDEYFEEFWMAFERELCNYQQPMDAESAFSWAYNRSKLVNEVSSAFNRYPLQALKPDRLSRLLLATASDDLKNNLFTSYLRMLGFLQNTDVNVYEFKQGQDWDFQPFELKGTCDVFTYFLSVKANPFLEHHFITDQSLVSLGHEQLARLIDLLHDKMVRMGGTGTEDITNLEAILRAMQIGCPDADVTGYAVAYWRSVGMMFGHSEKSFTHNTWNLLEKVIVDTQSQLLFDRASAYMVAIPGMTLPIEATLEIGLSIAAYDDQPVSSDPENPRFSIERSIGKKILNAEVQKAILMWARAPELNQTKPCIEKAMFLYQAIQPMLLVYRHKLIAKKCPFNPANVPAKTVLADISEGQWFNMRVGFEISSSYKNAFDELGVEVIFKALKPTSSDLIDLIAKHIAERSEKCQRMAFHMILEESFNPPVSSDGAALRMRLFEVAYAKRLCVQSGAFLFDGIEDIARIVFGMRLLGSLGWKISGADILARNPDEAIATSLLEIDLGL